MTSIDELGTVPAVRLHDVTVRLGRRRSARTALAGLDFDLTTGVHGLLGPNGAGKTTLMRVLATVLPVTAGEVTLFGHDIRQERARHDVRRRLGYLPQSFGSYPRFTVREFVEYFAWLKEVPAARAATAVNQAIERVGLADRAGSRMKALSGGMLRRAGLAQALVNNPELILLDEPTAGLDPEQRISFRHLVQDLGREAAVLISTHIVEDIASVCDDVMLLHDGRVIMRGTPDALARLGENAGEPGAATSALERGYTVSLRGTERRGGQW